MNVRLGSTDGLTTDQRIPFTISLERQDFRHGWVLGKTGTGKSTLLRNLIVELILAGKGVAVIDPHGDLVNDIMNYIPPDLLKKLVYLHPKNGKIPGIGLLDYPDKSQALRTFLTWLEAHSKGKEGTGYGKQSASIARNFTRAILELFKHPTIVHLYALLADDDLADLMLSQCKDFRTRKFHKQYWNMSKKDRVEKFSHILNKIEEMMEPGIIEFYAQAKSLNFRKLMDEQKIVLITVPKSYLEERGARILGSSIMMKFKVEASRRKKRNKDFFIIPDEFHNFVDGIDVDTTFPELRKYGVRLIVTNQTIKQLGDNADIIMGNVSHIFAFRLSAKDAKEIEENIGGNKDDFTQLVMIPNFHFKALSLEDGNPTPSNEVRLDQYPEDVGPVLPARKVIAWAKENTGKPKDQIQKEIDRILNARPPKAKAKKTRKRTR